MRCFNIGQWSGNKYTYNDTTQDCKLFVSRFLSGTNPKLWTLLGDSTMRRLFRTIISTKQLKCHRLQKCYKTNNTFNEYIDFQFGIKTKGKSVKEQSKCESEIHGCKGKFQEIEYIENHFTTNKNIKGLNVPKYVLFNFYLSTNPRDVCIVNAGLHDQNPEQSSVTDYEYLENVKEYIGFLRKPCKYIIWISTNNVLDLKQYGQKNARIRLWNSLVEQMLRKEFPDVGYIDMYPMSTIRAMHQDNVHMKPVYYNKEASFFI